MLVPKRNKIKRGKMNPLHKDLVWRQTLEKELDLWCCQQLGVSKDAPLQDVRNKEAKPSELRLPQVGQKVTISGSRRRPDLNGLQGEILGDSDNAGRLEVRVDRPGGPGRRMRISGHRLSRSLSMAGISAVDKPLPEIKS